MHGRSAQNMTAPHDRTEIAVMTRVTKISPLGALLALLATMALALLALGGAARAQSSDDALSDRTAIVHYGDLDLARPQSAARLYARLSAAAERVCSPLDTPDLNLGQRHRHCVEDALDAAIAQVADPRLTAYHLARLHGHVRSTPSLAQRVSLDSRS
jgi:UrcA family protein